MEGPSNAFDHTEKMGMIPRTVMQIWEQTSKLQEKGWAYTMEGSFLEIYNESIRDLLGDGSSGKKHEIRHNTTNNTTFVVDLTVKPLTSPGAVIALLKKAASNRQVAETLCNERSSRSHRFVSKNGV
jgi:kinesin family protein C1